MSEKQHCELSPSSAHRWMHCPGSVRMARAVTDRGSDYAREGSAAHAIAEICLRNGKVPRDFLGMNLDDIEVTQEMVEAVQVYVDYVRGLMKFASWYQIERGFDIAMLRPPGPMFGTSDFVAVITDELHVCDYKHGAGVPVEVKGNPQLLYYALGAYMSLEGQVLLVRRIILTVIQPRAPHPDGPIRKVELEWSDLVDFWEQLQTAAERTIAPDAPLVTGPHCRFCPALAQCPEAQSKALVTAQREFGMSALPGVLDDTQVGHALTIVDEWLEDWIHALREYAVSELKAGRTIPGYKLVPKRAMRKWKDEAAVEQWLKTRRLTRAGHEQRLLSPAAMEKALGPNSAIPQELIVKESSGVTLARDSDPRPAIAAGQEFFQIEGVESECPQSSHPKPS